jgi:hypothetical protein
MAEAVDSTSRRLTTRITAEEALANLASVLRLCETGSSAAARRAVGPAPRLSRWSLRCCGRDFYPDHPIEAFTWPLLVQAGGRLRRRHQR